MAQPDAAPPAGEGVSRRVWLATPLLGLGRWVPLAALAACANPAAPADTLVETDGSLPARRLSPAELQARLRGCDFVLLGELHDNPLHHRLRGQLIAALGRGTVVVAEHLNAGQRVGDTGAGADLLPRLQAAGFDERGWRWPLHRALFEPVLAAGVSLVGGNAERELVRRVVREGEAALPGTWRELLAAAPLSPSAQAALDRALIDGHCGQLPPARVPAMRLAQRARDAAMALAMAGEADAGGRPVVLVAGNGHVRRDHGVPQLLRVLRPGARLLSVGFAEAGQMLEAVDLQWTTAGLVRDDPCAGMRLPSAASAPARATP